MRRDAAVAQEGGASRIELCADLTTGGLTPSSACIAAARSAFSRPGLVVMVRPRAGAFTVSAAERSAMRDHILRASDLGADAVVFGVLDEAGRVDVASARELADLARSLALRSTFHRALDATPDPVTALDALIDLGFDRVLTAGIPWGHPGTALDGLDAVRRVLHRAAGRIEVILSGGLSPLNLPDLLATLPATDTPLSLHVHTALHENGRLSPDLLFAFIRAARK